MSLFRSLFGKIAPPPPPVEEAKAPPPVIEEAYPTTDRRRAERVNAREGTRVLIVDDSPTVVAALKKILISAGYTTREAFDAEAGLELARKERPELIFLDIVLPGMNGFAALRMMRRDPATQHIPVIMISGNEQATEQFYANRIGADDFMKKPFSRAEVFARIAPLLDANMVPRRKGVPHEEPRPAGPASEPAAPAPETMVFTPAPQESSALTAAPQQPAAQSLAPAPTPPAPPAPLQPTPTPVAATAAPAAAPVSQGGMSALDARKELTAMGLQYFDQNQFVAAIQRGDKLAFELFVAGGGVDLAAETNGKTPLQVARENGRTQIFALLRAKLSAAATAGSSG